MPGHTEGKGRYSGIGIYAAGEMWSQIVRGDAAEKGANATQDDDDQIIVVIDSRTGVAKHAVDLAAERQAALKGGR
jgi:hypothetical protein